MAARANPPRRSTLHFDAADLGEPAFGWMVEARSLRVALNAALPGLPRLHVFAPAQPTVTRTAEGALVALADGTEIAARLVVAPRAAAARCAAPPASAPPGSTTTRPHGLRHRP